jgi:hypothetical protein
MNKFFFYLLLIFSVIVTGIIIFFSAKSSAKVQEDIRVKMGDVRYLEPKKIKEICGNSKIQKLVIEDAPYGHYDLKLELDDGRLISVNKEQFLNAKEGKKCKNIVGN